MLLTEMFLDEKRHYDWTSPIILYRGSQRGDPNPFTDTRLGYPTFSDVPLVADGYGDVFRYAIKLNNPCVLWEGEESEIVIEIGTLQQRLRYTDQDMIKIVRGTYLGFNWRCGELDKNGAEMTDEEIINILHTPFDAIETPITINAYAIAATQAFQQRAISLGYDAFILRGPFTGDIGKNRIDITSDNSWDGVTALEWMVFKPSCVKLLNKVNESEELCYVQPDGSFKKGGDRRSTGRKVSETIVYKDRFSEHGYRRMIVAINPTKAEWKANFPYGAAGVLLKDGRIVVGDGSMLAHDVILNKAGIPEEMEAYRLQICLNIAWAELWISDDYVDENASRKQVKDAVAKVYGETLETIETKIKAAVSRFMGDVPVKAIPLGEDQECLLPEDEAFRDSCFSPLN